jgi:hypothetical protein
MKKLIVTASILVLAACGQPATEDAPASEEMAETAAVEGAGTFDYAADDGSGGGRIVMNEDGTYADTYEGETTTGKWTAGDGQTCFTPDAEGSEETCWTDGEPAEDGSFTSTAPDGTTVTVTPVVEEAAAA